MPEPLPIVIVGGGLTGLAAALALRRRGVEVAVVERSIATTRPGASLSIDTSLLEEVTGCRTDALPVLRDSAYDFAAWEDLHRWLEAKAADAGIEVERGREVLSVDTAATGGGAELRLAGGGRRRAALVIGADGVRSVLRNAVETGQAEPDPGGYLVWRGMVAESALPRGTPLPPEGDTFVVQYSPGFAIGAYAVPGADGGIRRGRRRLSFAWCDPRPHPSVAGLLERRRTITPAAIDDALARNLTSTAHSIWPRPWRETVAVAFATKVAFGTPIAEHLPQRLVAGRVALVGDAAHSVSPVTGAGLHYGLLDVLALAEALAECGVTDMALARYERERLTADQQLVRTSRRMARDWMV